jgi:dihydrofolate reductase
MRSIRLFIACSLDGYIAREDGGVDWLFHDQDYGMSEFYKSIDTVLIGRKTHDFMIRSGFPYYKGKKNCVFSRSKKPEKTEHVQFVSEDVRDFVEALQKRPGKGIWLVGGARLIESFLKEGLIDEMILSIHPVVLGKGIPLFGGDFKPIDLELSKCVPYDSGLVQLWYRRSA